GTLVVVLAHRLRRRHAGAGKGHDQAEYGYFGHEIPLEKLGSYGYSKGARGTLATYSPDSASARAREGAWGAVRDCILFKRSLDILIFMPKGTHESGELASLR